MNTRHILKTLPAVGLLLSLFVGSTQNAEAAWYWRRPPYFQHRRGYDRIVVLPRESIRIEIGGIPYHYCRGIFYRPEPQGYVIVPAPIGVTVAAIPDDHQTVVVNGITYHYYDGAFYKGGPAGYTVVPVPVPVNTATDTPTSASLDKEIQETLVVNVPNSNGSYMPVKLQMAKDGTYVGPQGEVYPTKPDISQLKAMYGK